ncbi:MAG: hypothetical protein GZ088_06405 [Acidipila sp.]|nr:hypothetical protein [Acidipila sp.]
MLQAKTAAIVANETTATWTELVQTLNPDISDEAYDKLRTSYFNAIVLPRLKPNFNAKVNFEYFMKGTHRPPFGQPFPKGVLRRALFENESEESANLRKRFTKLMAQLNRLTVVADPETADVVLEVRRYKPLDFSIGNTETVCFILVWPQGANPKTDQVMWFEKFEAKWKTSDDVAGAFRSFKRDLGLALKQAETADVRR